MPPIPPPPPRFPGAFVRIFKGCQKMLNVPPSKRMPAKDVCKDPYFRNALRKSNLVRQLCSSMREKDIKKFGSKKVCLGMYFDEHNRMKRNLYQFKFHLLSQKKPKV